MDFKHYRGKNILAWLSYNANYEDPYGGVNRVCYVYPRILIKGTDYDPINSDDFPKYGRIEVRIQGGDTAEEVYSSFGSLVNIKINGDPYPNYEGNNMYSLKYNPQYGKNNSEIWIEAFSGKGFYQIIDINSDFKTVQSERFIPEPDFTIRTALIMLRNEDKLYGPFECDTKEGITTLHGIKDYQYNVGEYNALTYNDNLLIIEDDDEEEALILMPKSSLPSPEGCDVRYDWISKEVLIGSFMDSLRTENSYTRAQVRQITDVVNHLIESGCGVQMTDERISKIQILLDNISQKEEYVRSIVQYALNDEASQKAITEEVVTNYFDQIKDKIPDFTVVQDHISELKAQELSLRETVEELRSKTASSKAESSEEDKARISDLTQKLEEIQKENDALSQEIEVHKDITALKAERDRLAEDRDQKLVAYKDLERQINATLEAFNDQAKQTARILDRKLLDKILSGIGEETASQEIVPFDTSLLHNQAMDCSEIISRVKTFICDKAHREVTMNDVANYLICITQGFITTFAGEPGTGKTSLCNILAKALGLAADPPQNRFVDISVERGWSSHKDFIGYYNPLSKKMERSNGEVFDSFERMDAEYDCDNSKIAPFVILLDEANLSPIEHYWAAFLRNCDFISVNNRTISLGGTKSFKLPEHLRFLATVNFDHTTEELSPRFLDRSWVIMLEPTRIDDEIDEETENIQDMISFGDLKEAFSVGANDIIDEAIQNKWNAIQKIFRDRALQIMPRNLKMVRNYCAVGCRCMERDTPVTKFAPLDYALSEKILPTINGNGDNYRMLIEELSKECTPQNMPITARHLERMKRFAENNMGFYQFFSH